MLNVEQNIILDGTQEAELLQIIPRKPLISSQELKWEGINIQHHRQPSWETPYICGVQHSIIVHHSKQVQAERWLENHKYNEQVVKGDITIIPASIQNKHIWDRETEFSLLWLDPTHLARTAYESIDVERFEIVPHSSISDPLIYQLCLGLNSELGLGGSFSRLYVDSLIIALSIHLIRQYSVKKQLINDYSDGLSKCKLQRVISYINEHLTEDLSLKALSKVVDMSPHYFTSLFKQSTGMSAYQYVIYCRMERAKRLLRKQDLPVSAVSKQVGFVSLSHFSNVFRKYTKTTPTLYRQDTK
jgi:AraC family transcriptional regulator